MATYIKLEGTLIVGVLNSDIDPDMLAPGWVNVPYWAGLETKPFSGWQPYYINNQIVWKDPVSLYTYKEKKWEQLKSKRQELDSKPIAIRDFFVNTDGDSIINIIGAVLGMQLSGETTKSWRCYDNVMRTLSFQDLAQLGLDISNRRQTLIEISDNLYQQLMAEITDTTEKVDAITWPQE